MSDLLVGNTSGKNTAEGLLKILNKATSPYRPVKDNLIIPIEITGLEGFPTVEECKHLKPLSIDLSIGYCLDDLGKKIKNHINNVLVKLLEMCGFSWLFFVSNREDFEITDTTASYKSPTGVINVSYKGTPLFEIYRHYGFIENPEPYKFTCTIHEEYYLIKNDSGYYYSVKVELDLEEK